ncbi:MAG: hypothetical protein LBP22_05605 [Deltaproteobacteria bacterium]|jgi:hypothetical protein|nr:hypothetical protein [Deltaproteobacteria bacterium]
MPAKNIRDVKQIEKGEKGKIQLSILALKSLNLTIDASNEIIPLLYIPASFLEINSTQIPIKTINI